MKCLMRYVGILALAALMPLTPVRAQQKGVGPWHPVKDEINFFSPQAKERADEKIAALKKAYNKDLYIEAIKAPPHPANVDLKDKKAVDEFFTEYARTRFKKADVNGVYIMIIENPAKLRVEVGNNTRVGGYFTSENRDALVEKMIDKLKAKDHDGALAAATSYVPETMQRNHPNPNQKAKAAAPAVHAPVAHVNNDAPSGFSWMPILMIIGVILVVWIVFALIRSLFAGGGAGGPGMGYGGGGGGFMSSLLGGMFGAAAGMWMYSHFFGGNSSQAWGAGPNDGGMGGGPDTGPADTSSTGGGGDFDNDGGAGGGGDWGADKGGGDAGGGDWGGGGGGGDWGGGGGGDFGGGGGGDWGGGGGGGDW